MRMMRQTRSLGAARHGGVPINTGLPLCFPMAEAHRPVSKRGACSSRRITAQAAPRALGEFTGTMAS